MARQDTLPVISQIKINGQLYNIRDKMAPEGALHFLGINAWPGTGAKRIYDGATGTSTPSIWPIKLKTGVEISATDLQTGDVILQIFSDEDPSKGYQEFVWIKSSDSTIGTWELLGDEGSYVIKGTYTTSSAATGITVGAPTFTGTTETISLSGSIAGQNAPVEESTDTSVPAVTLTGTLGGMNSVSHTHTFSVTNATVTVTASYQPKGSVSTPTFTGTADTHSHEIFVSEEDVPLSRSNYHPQGTISAHSITTKTFTGDSKTVTVTASYQPAGTISNPGISWNNKDAKTVVTGISAISPSTATVYTASPTVTNEVLEFVASTVVTGVTGGTASGTASVIGSAATMKLAATPTFTGTTATITSTGTYQASGSLDIVIADHTFTGVPVILDTGDYTLTPAGTISQPTFTGTTQTITSTGTYVKLDKINDATISIPTTVSITKRLIAKVASTSFSASGSFQPKGTVSAPAVTDPGHTHTIALS